MTIIRVLFDFARIGAVIVLMNIEDHLPSYTYRKWLRRMLIAKKA